ncbi:TraC family protein [Desulfurobacterium sp.]
MRKSHKKVNGFISTPQEVLKEIYESVPLSQFLPYVAFDSERQLYILADGRAAVVFEVPPLVVAGEDFITGCRSLISEVREGSIVQFTMYASPNIKPFLDRWQVPDHPNPVIRKLFEKRIEFFKEYNKHPHPFTGTPFRDFRLFISVIFPPPEGNSVSNFINIIVDGVKSLFSFSKKDEAEDIDYEKYLQDCYDEALSLKSAIESAGFTYDVQQVLQPAEFISTMREIFNPNHDFSKNFPYDDEVEIREQMIFADSGVFLPDPETVVVDGKYLGAFSVKNYPAGEFEIFRMLEVFGDLATGDRADQVEYPFLVSAAVYKLTEAEEMKKIARLQQYKSSYSQEAIQKYVKIRDQVEELGIYETIRHRNRAAAKLCKITITGFFYADGEDLESGKRELRRVFRKIRKLWSKAGFELQYEKFKLLPTFIFSLPMCPIKETMEFLRRQKTVLAISVPNLIPVQADWKGTGWYKKPHYPGFVFFSRRGQIQLVSLWDSDTNYNLFIAAQSGAGKSVLMSEIAVNFIARGGKVYGIDVGRSYKRIVKLFDGQMIVFTSGTCINPFTNSILARIDELKNHFDKVTLKTEVTAEMEQLVRLFAVMCGLDRRGFADAKGILEQAIRTAISEKGTEAGVKDVRDVLVRFQNAQGFSEVRNIISSMVQALYPFAEGRYAHFFNGPATINIDKDFVVLELEEVNQLEGMKEVVLLSLMMILSQKIYLGDKSIPKLFFIDEAWDLLRGEHTAAFIETGYRRFRKYNTAAATITQSILDFFLDENKAVGQAIISNSEFMFLLNQKETDLSKAFKDQILTLDKLAERLVKSVRTQKGKFSEIFVKNSNTWGIMRFMLDRFSYYLYTTEAAETSEIDRLVASGYTLEQAIEEMIRREKRL